MSCSWSRKLTLHNWTSSPIQHQQYHHCLSTMKASVTIFRKLHVKENAHPPFPAHTLVPPYRHKERDKQNKTKKRVRAAHQAFSATRRLRVLSPATLIPPADAR